MNLIALTILQELEQYGRHHEAQEAEHARKLLNLAPATAELIRC
jgi:hypothetical protein